MLGYFPADITQTICLYPDTYCMFKSCKKSRSFYQCSKEDKLIFYNNISEKYFPSLCISNHFTFDFCLHQFSNTNLTLACLRYTSDEKNTAFEIQILSSVKFSLHIPISLLSVENWEAVTRIIDGVHFSMCDS